MVISSVLKLRRIIRTGKFDCAISFVVDINIIGLLSGIGLRVPILCQNEQIRKAAGLESCLHFLKIGFIACLPVSYYGQRK